MRNYSPDQLCPPLQEHLVLCFLVSVITFCVVVFENKPLYAQSQDCYDCSYGGGVCFEADGFMICEHSVTNTSGAVDFVQYVINLATGEESQTSTGPGACNIDMLAACAGNNFACGAKGAAYLELGWPVTWGCATCDCSGNPPPCTDPCGCDDSDGDGVNDLCDPCPSDPLDACVPPPDDPPPDDPPPDDPPPDDPPPDDPPADPCQDPAYEGHTTDTDGDGCNDCEDTEPDNERLGCGQCEGDLDCDGCPEEDDDDDLDPEVTSKKCNPECPDMLERFTDLLQKIEIHLGWNRAPADNSAKEYCILLSGFDGYSYLLCVDFATMEIYESAGGNRVRHGAASTALLTMSSTIYYALLAVIWWRFIPRFFKIFRSL